MKAYRGPLPPGVRGIQFTPPSDRIRSVIRRSFSGMNPIRGIHGEKRLCLDSCDDQCERTGVSVIRSLNLAQVEHLSLVPVAAVGMSPGEFARAGIELETSIDDLDRYQIAVFEVPGQGVFALARYCNATSEGTDLLLESSVAGDPELASMIRCVAQELDVSESLFRWNNTTNQAQVDPAKVANLAEEHSAH